MGYIIDEFSMDELSWMKRIHETKILHELLIHT
jgi:hypothetical protein